MVKELHYLPSHILFCLIVGIGLQFNFEVWSLGFNKLYLLITIFLITCLIIHKLKKKRLFIFSTSLLFILIGISTTYITSKNNYNNYYKRYITSTSNLVLRIEEKLKSNNYNHRFIGKIITVDGKKAKGNLIININKSSKNKEPFIGDFIYTKCLPKQINNPKNPYSFNYRKYLKAKSIEEQLYVNSVDYYIIKNEHPSFINGLAIFKNTLQKKLKNKFSKDVYGIISSLLLGERKEVSKELIKNYEDAGAIHILAISGLHIGILVFILSTLLSPILYFKYGKLIKLVILISLLWLFAVFTGLSASVVRAATMFTFMVIGDSLKQKQPIENSLISSMLVLLLVNPLFLFDVGFQLSYIAVYSIVKLQPLIVNVWKPKYLILKKIWQLTTVSFAAQIGVLPLSLYYFNQFPSLFIISNLIIIPCLGFILLSGIIIIILILIECTPELIIQGYEYGIQLMNFVIKWLAVQEDFIFKNISLSLIEMLCWYVLMVLFFGFIINKSTKKFIAFLTLVITLQALLITSKYERNTKKELIVFHKNKTSMLGIRKSNTLKIYSNLSLNELEKEQSISNYILYEKVSLKVASKKARILSFTDETILSIDSLGVYPKDFQKKAIVHLKHSPKVNLNRLIDNLQPKLIIADGSNYKSYINRWQKTCEKQKTPFHSTQQNGAYILKY